MSKPKRKREAGVWVVERSYKHRGVWMIVHIPTTYLYSLEVRKIQQARWPEHGWRVSRYVRAR